MQMVLEDVKDALTRIMKESSRFNGNPNKIILSGHSAGGYLALMTYLMNESLRSNIQTVCSLSSIFELAAIRDSYLNDEFQLDETDVKR